MRRFYVCPKSVFEEPIVIAGQHRPRYNLFHLAIGSAYMDLDDGHILLCTDFDSEWAEGTWHAHSDVARLPHPTLEGNVPIAHLHQKPEYAHKQFKPKHFAVLQQALGLGEAHTVWDLHNKLQAAGWKDLHLSNVY